VPGRRSTRGARRRAHALDEQAGDAGQYWTCAGAQLQQLRREFGTAARRRYAPCGTVREPGDRRLLLAPLVILGIASVAYWRWSALAGMENLRPYMAVQFGSIALVLAIALLYRSRYTHGAAIFALAAAYAVAKVVESLDLEVYALGHWVSGHTLKHLAAALGVWLLLAALQRRRLRG